MQITIIGLGGIPIITTLENQDSGLAVGSIQADVKALSAFINNNPPQAVLDAADMNSVIVAAINSGAPS